MLTHGSLRNSLPVPSSVSALLGRHTKPDIRVPYSTDALHAQAHSTSARPNGHILQLEKDGSRLKRSLERHIDFKRHVVFMTSAEKVRSKLVVSPFTPGLLNPRAGSVMHKVRRTLLSTKDHKQGAGE
ncbi:hypothetical protein NDU88_004026 [Pleurodeles waltl]|uniref:Uncharacterized protein n=1 Tax=Pleurodeles waltl TaxID=8319 RepID=A0AAV7TRE6_PLEWA|nr:hypothetical protein NDU88_004026 [Pleurodeles waltl]